MDFEYLGDVVDFEYVVDVEYVETWRDLGGGTFDAAYSRVRRGRTSVCADLGVQAVQWGDLGRLAGAGQWSRFA